MNLMKVLSNVKGKDKIPTNSPLDLILDGGIERRSITQFYGLGWVKLICLKFSSASCKK